MSRKLVVILFALAMLSLANMACGGGGTDNSAPTAAPEDLVIAETNEGSAEEEAVEAEAQAESYVTVTKPDGTEVELAQSTLNSRKACFAQLPKGEDSISALPAEGNCTWGLVTEFYAEGYGTKACMQENGSPGWVCQ
jgi:hypothetical protein